MPVWHSVVHKNHFKSIDNTQPQWKVLPRNAEVIKDNRMHGYELKITKVNKANNGWYGCYGQHSYVDFLAIGYLEVISK